MGVPIVIRVHLGHIAGTSASYVTPMDAGASQVISMDAGVGGKREESMPKNIVF